ncbi:MAG: leucine--tRNA ligase [Sphingobacteriales bacterium]|nr:leucine--tRNA ligase [Sphingobacteriales bacterium]
MDYNFSDIEQKWKSHWQQTQLYKVHNDTSKPKYYILDMFPYPSGEGLHVGHPLGYIATDIFARYKRLNGFNVLHPMGFDSFGLPAENYAIQTGQHPAITITKSSEVYRQQLNNIGLSFDWSREVSTSDPKYYRWTQWIVLQFFDSWYNATTDKAEPISTLIAHFEQYGSHQLNAICTEHEPFNANDWCNFTETQQQALLINYRLFYPGEGEVWYCEALGCVLANDEVKDGVSERGGHPVERRKLPQWFLRMAAYAQRLLDDLNDLDWSESMKDFQRNWIGKSEGALVHFPIQNHHEPLSVFTTRPDTIFGVTFMVVAPEHDLVAQITTEEQKSEIDTYIKYVKSRSERDRISEVKTVTGAFTGAYAINPFTNLPIPIYISEYVLAGYGTGAIMAVPSSDDRDFRFAKHFDIPIVYVIADTENLDNPTEKKRGTTINSGFLNGLDTDAAISQAVAEIEKRNLGKGKINYRMRDSNFSRQRYWGEPIPILHKYRDQTLPLFAVPENELPVTLPDVTSYVPRADGQSPLANVEEWLKTPNGWRETDTLPGAAGSSWYFLRYMDPHNEQAFCSPEAIQYWENVDFYAGGSEHAGGHLLYSRVWHKFLYDRGLVTTKEPFKKLFNQGMIQGRSNFVYRAQAPFYEEYFNDFLQKNFAKYQPVYVNKGVDFCLELCDLDIEVASSNSDRKLSNLQNTYEQSDRRILVVFIEQLIEWINTPEKLVAFVQNAIDSQNKFIFADNLPAMRSLFISQSKLSAFSERASTTLHVNVNLVQNDVLNIDGFRAWREEYKDAAFWLDDNSTYRCGWAIEKMSKSKHNVVNPDEIIAKYGCDCFRMFEMFLGPLEVSKPWNTDNIEGTSRFLRKFWRLFNIDESTPKLSTDQPSAAELKVLHRTIKAVVEDVERYSLNTCVSHFMKCVNDLTDLKCQNQHILTQLTILMAPFAPYITEELWHLLGNEGSVHTAKYPVLDEAHLVESVVSYPVQIGGKVRATIELPANCSQDEARTAALSNPRVLQYTEGKEPKKFVFVPNRIINIVV